jgi:hypothetical protein
MGTLLQDFRYGLRVLVKKPTFTIVAVLTLALGVGANTAIFSIVNAVLLRSLPFPDPDRLVRIYFNNPGVGLRGVRFSVPEFDDLRTQTDVFEDVSVIVSGPTNLTGAKQPEHLEMVEVSPNYFSMLGATPELGRLFGHQDFALGFAPVVVISDALWRRSYGADPGVLGRSLRLDKRSVYDCRCTFSRISQPRIDHSSRGGVDYMRIQWRSVPSAGAWPAHTTRGDRSSQAGPHPCASSSVARCPDC